MFWALLLGTSTFGQMIVDRLDVDMNIGICRFILNNLTAVSSSDPTSPAGVAAAEFLITKIQDVRSMLSTMTLSKTIPVGNGDAGSYTNVQLLGAVDYFMSNIHPW